MQTKQLPGPVITGTLRQRAPDGWPHGLEITEEDVPAFVLLTGIFSLWRCRAYRFPFIWHYYFSVGFLANVRPALGYRTAVLSRSEMTSKNDHANSSHVLLCSRGQGSGVPWNITWSELGKQRHKRKGLLVFIAHRKHRAVYIDRC